MEENEEKPDLVVWDKEKGYYFFKVCLHAKNYQN
jgi:hypothetical protein